MATMDKYPTLETPTTGTIFPVYDVGNSDTRKMTLDAIVDFVNKNIDINTSGFVTQYSAPSATGFTVNVTDNQNSIHLILTPLAGYAAGTIVLPLASNTLDGQRVLVNCTQAVSTLTVSGNGATGVIGAPTTISANDFFTLKFDKVTSNWYRIG